MANPSPLDIVLDRIKAKLYNREGNYGAPKAMHLGIAKLWSAYLFVKTGQEIALDEHDAAAMLELFKIGRVCNNYTEDNGDDRIGYPLLDQVMREVEKIEANRPIQVHHYGNSNDKT